MQERYAGILLPVTALPSPYGVGTLGLGSYFVPEKYREGYSRCDLHPRFRPDGSQIGFNSVHEGSRQVYLRDIKW